MQLVGIVFRFIDSTERSVMTMMMGGDVAIAKILIGNAF